MWMGEGESGVSKVGVDAGAAWQSSAFWEVDMLLSVPGTTEDLPGWGSDRAGYKSGSGNDGGGGWEKGKVAYRRLEWMRGQLGKAVHFEKWTCCFRCQVPQSICQDGYLTGQCIYPGVVLTAGAVMIGDTEALDRMEDMGVTREYRKGFEWYGEMGENGGKETTDILVGFFEIFLKKK